MNIVDRFFESAEIYPGQIAILEKGTSISYRDLSMDVLQTAAYFRKKGIRKGDRVLVFVPMSTDLYRIVLALFSIGATVVFLDEWVSKKRMEICCQIADCKGFIGIFKARVVSLFSKELRSIPIKLSTRKRLAGPFEIENMHPNDSALITFTTGSVGRPKAANRTHSFLHEQFKAVLEEIEPSKDDIDLPLLPIVFLVNLGVGCTSIIGDVKLKKGDKMTLDKVVDQLVQNNATRFSSSPFFVTMLAQYLVERNISLPNLKKIFTGGAPVFPNEAELYKKAFPKTDVRIVYGSTEVDPISTIEAGELLKKRSFLNRGLPVGIPFEKSIVRIIQIKKSAISLAGPSELDLITQNGGEIGEIIVSGPHVLKSYYNSEQAFKENKIVVGDVIWHRTGDSGFFLGEELLLTGRCKDLISSDGKIISPFIVENQLQEIDKIRKGTILEIDGRILLCVESELVIEEIEDITKDIEKDGIKKVAKIPMDPRHNSKIDYNALRLILQSN